MLCQKCHKNLATVRYAEVVDGRVTEQHLCAECLFARQGSGAMGFEFSGPTPVQRRQPAEKVAQEVVRAQRKCTSCGVELSQVADEGTVGCAACYGRFDAQIEPMLAGLHASLRHKGKVAHLDDARARLRVDLQTKRALLRSVLQAENYEEAARLRDEIRSLETGLCVSESGAD